MAAFTGAASCLPASSPSTCAGGSRAARVLAGRMRAWSLEAWPAEVLALVTGLELLLEKWPSPGLELWRVLALGMRQEPLLGAWR